MRRLILALQIAAAGMALVGGGLVPARAVVIATGDGSGNTTAPAGGSGWTNMARIANGSAVYLGNGWMITAAHVIQSVGNAPVTFTNGEVIDAVPGSDMQLINPASLQATNEFSDLKMFRLASDPGLPAMPIVSTAPAAGKTLMLIGAGRNREPNLIGWTVSSSFAWTQTALPFDNARGFALDTQTSQMRWGMAPAGNGGTTLTTDASNPTITTATFATNFNSVGTPYAAQAVLGDSGGGAFQFVNGSWHLAGIIDSINSTVQNQPASTAVYGNNQTLSGDLTAYSVEIQALLSHPGTPVQNAATALAASLATPDAHNVLLMINALQDGKGGPLTGGPVAADPSFDVNGDGLFNLKDVLQTINYLMDNPPMPTISATSMTSASVSPVPEPSTCILALLGILLVGLARRRRR